MKNTKDGRVIDITFNCSHCGESYHPHSSAYWRHERSGGQGLYYCSYQCHWDYLHTSKGQQLRNAPQDDRNKQLVYLLSSGEHTLQQLATAYGISRERVRQIYFKTTGKSHWEKRAALISATQDTRRKIQDNTIRFTCKGCQKVVTNKTGKHAWIFCHTCRKLRMKTQRVPEVWWVCDFCRVKFHPYASSYYLKPPTTTQFCCNDHYIEYRKIHGMPPRKSKEPLSHGL